MENKTNKEAMDTVQPQNPKDMNTRTIELMNNMHLFGMSEAYKTSLGSTFAENMTPDAFLFMLLNSEWDHRHTLMVQRLTKQAGFRYNAYMEDIDYDTPHNLNRNQMERLATLDFVREGQNLFITGPTGTGKSTLAEAIARRACENGIKTFYSSTSKLLNKLKSAKAKGTYEADMKKIERCPLLVLDDLFIIGLDSKERPILLDIIEDRHGRKSMIITSQIPVSEWYDAIGDPTMADAILDRIVHTAHRIELTGESMRKIKRNK